MLCREVIDVVYDDILTGRYTVTTACGISITFHHQTMHTLHCRVLIQFLNDAAYSLVNSDNSCTTLVGVFTL